MLSRDPARNRPCVARARKYGAPQYMAPESRMAMSCVSSAEESVSYLILNGETRTCAVNARGSATPQQLRVRGLAAYVARIS